MSPIQPRNGLRCSPGSRAMRPLAVALLSMTGVVACSGESDVSIFDTPQPEAPALVGDAGNFFQPGEGDGKPPTPEYCSPVDAPGLRPSFATPGAFGQGACSAAQMDTFYKVCLASPVGSAECQAFTAANAGCARCLQSQDTDPVQGAVVWHGGGTYYTVNLSGCIGRALGDVSSSSCAAAYEAALQCRRATCAACFQTRSPSFQKFVDCQGAASKSVCKSYGDAWRSACPDVRSGAPGQCFPASATATTEDAYRTIAPLFCGAPR